MRPSSHPYVSAQSLRRPGRPPTRPGELPRKGAFQLSFWEIPPVPVLGAAALQDTPPRREPDCTPASNRAPAALHRDSSEAAEAFVRTYRRLRLPQPAPAFHVSFRHFTGLRSAIRTRDRNSVEARLSDLLQDAPPIILEALAEILITRLYRKRTSREASDCYNAWAGSPATTHRIEEIRRTRGRKRLLHPRGNHFNLREIFDDLNTRFFAGGIHVARIGWSPNRSRRMLGHYDSSHRTITVTRWLDGGKVPRYVVEYLVYHEMLHAQFPVERRNHRRVVHSDAFRKAERSFPDYERAERWIKGGWKSARNGAGRPGRGVGSNF